MGVRGRESAIIQPLHVHDNVGVSVFVIVCRSLAI